MSRKLQTGIWRVVISVWYSRDEISDLREQMQRLADILEKTLDIESILQMAEGATEMEDDMPKSLKQLFADPHVQKDTHSETTDRSGKR